VDSRKLSRPSYHSALDTDTTNAIKFVASITNSKDWAGMLVGVNARESIRVTGEHIDWIYPGRNELTSYTID